MSSPDLSVFCRIWGNGATKLSSADGIDTTIPTLWKVFLLSRVIMLWSTLSANHCAKFMLRMLRTVNFFIRDRNSKAC